MDFNQISVAALMVHLMSTGSTEFDEDMLRHMILNTIRFNLMKFRNTFGDMVIATDATSTWRKKAFPFYKAKRVKDKEESPIDWSLFRQSIGTIQEEIRTNFHYPVISVTGAEGDDIISVMTKYNSGHNQEKTLILSGDKDFKQLHSIDGVFQYSPVQKEDVTVDDPELYKFTHILKGDRGDGIPNVRSADDTFVTETRQKPITQKMIDEWYVDRSLIPDKWDRNENLINLDNTPLEIAKETIKQYKSQSNKPRVKSQYFMDHGLNVLYNSMQEF